MELDDLKKLIDILKDTDITDIQIDMEGAKVRLRREKLLTSFEATPPAVMPHSRRAEAAAAEGRPAQEEDAQRLVTVTAPLVGTFYRAASPDTPPFVEVGDSVKKGQVLCIVEAMKLMNEIECEADGVIVRVLVENAHPVEYGEPLFLIEPA
jgi:acetyl-CoA carboxylase biotin carboxyl carrier protein